ncbi:UPF0193 protein EVG1 homolog [Ptychodera flava]|uniref:UPF0193 protein EVG1 homolog n=1 Tax=Ptychodera flava TaxID=63121 RepID=UPI00396A7B3D
MANRGKGTVQKGGMWQGHTASYSKETQDLLKVMMAESKLTNFQQRQINSQLKDGKTLPLKVHPTSSEQPAPPPPSKPQSARVSVRGYSGGIRSRENIEKHMDDYKPDYRPLPKKPLGEREKDRLAHFMAYGEDLPKLTQKRYNELMAPKEPPPEIDRFDELQKEIAERQEFLADMEALGRGKEFRTIIATEISQLIREMEVIDRKRTAVLQRAIEADERRKAAAAQKSTNIPKPDVQKMEQEKSELSSKHSDR